MKTPQKNSRRRFAPPDVLIVVWFSPGSTRKAQPPDCCVRYVRIPEHFLLPLSGGGSIATNQCGAVVMIHAHLHAPSWHLATDLHAVHCRLPRQSKACPGLVGGGDDPKAKDFCACW